jgi:transcriptional regulator with XRE-family HTH domain
MSETVKKLRQEADQEWLAIQSSNGAIGSRIQELRRRKKLTQSELGEIIGVTASSIGQYEIGITKPKLDTLIKISRELSVNLEWLMTGDGECEKNTITSEDKGQFGKEVVDRLTKIIEELIQKDREKDETIRSLTITLGKPSGESSQRVGYNILAHNYKHISNNFGNTHLALCR